MLEASYTMSALIPLVTTLMWSINRKVLAPNGVTLKAAAKANAGLAAINAGFFTPEGKPLGVCIDSGKKTGYYNKTSLGSGAYVFNAAKQLQIIRRAKINQQLKASELLQAGPFLVENGKAISSLKASESRPRSFIAWDGKTGWLIGHVESITMKDLATMLQSVKLGGFKIQSALNLDGGRSCQFFVSAEVNGSDKQVSAFMNRKVRNFLVLKKRAK